MISTHYSPAWNTKKDTADNTTVKYNAIVELVSQDDLKNESTVNVKVHAWRPKNDGYTSYGSGNAYATVDGTLYSEKITATKKIDYGTYNFGGVNLLTKTGIVIKHDEDGTKQFTVSAYFKYDNIPLNAVSNSFTVDLPTITRYGLISMPSSDITVGDTVDIAVSNLEEGDTVSAGWTYPDDHPDKHIFTDFTTPTYQWDTTELLASITDANQKALQLYCTTTRDGVEIGTTYFDFTATIPETYKPTLSVEVSPVNSGLPSAFISKYIVGLSAIKVDFTGSSAEAHTSISAYGYILYDARGNVIGSDEKATIAGNIMQTAIITTKVAKVTAYITDERGFTTSQDEAITFNDYALPYVSPVEYETMPRAYRSTDGVESKTGTELYVSSGKRYSSIGGLNTAKLECSVDGGSTWETVLDTTDTDDFNGIISGVTLNKDSAYTVSLRVTDTLGKVAYFYAPIPKAFTTWRMQAGGTAIDIGSETVHLPISSGTISGLKWMILSDGTFQAEGVLYFAQDSGIMTAGLYVGEFYYDISSDLISKFDYNVATYYVTARNSYSSYKGIMCGNPEVVPYDEDIYRIIVPVISTENITSHPFIWMRVDIKGTILE